MRLILVLVSVVTFLLLTCQSTDQPRDDLSPLPKIAFNVLVDSSTNYDVFLMNLDGTQRENLTEGATGVDWAYHAVKDQIYFVSDRDASPGHYFLYRYDVSTQHCHKLLQERVCDSWIGSRNNGGELVICLHQPNHHSLVIIDSSGRLIREVLRSAPGESISDPCFSPDGHWIVYRSDRSGSDELWMMDDLGIASRQLTEYPPSQLQIDHDRYRAGPPKWVPSNRIISYISYLDGRYRILAIDRFGNEIYRIGQDTMDQGWHDWSADGEWIVYSGAQRGRPDHNIYLMDAAGTTNIVLSEDPREELAPLFVHVP